MAENFVDDSLDCYNQVVGSWHYRVQGGHQAYTIQPRANGKLFFRQVIHAEKSDGGIDEHVLEGDLDEAEKENDATWLKAQLTHSKTSQKEGVIRLRYNEATGTLLSVFNDGQREYKQSAARIAHDMEVVGTWKYLTKDFMSSVYSIEFGVDGQLCFRENGSHGSFYGHLEPEVDEDDALWLMGHLKDEHTGSNLGQMWMRYDHQHDTIHSKFVSSKGELCVTALRSNKDALKPANQNMIRNLSLQTRSPRGLTTKVSRRSASAHIAKNRISMSTLTETPQSVVTRDLGSFQGEALEVTRDLVSFQGGVFGQRCTGYQPLTGDAKEREIAAAFEIGMRNEHPTKASKCKEIDEAFNIGKMHEVLVQVCHTKASRRKESVKVRRGSVKTEAFKELESLVAQKLHMEGRFNERSRFNETTSYTVTTTKTTTTVTNPGEPRIVNRCEWNPKKVETLQNDVFDDSNEIIKRVIPSFNVGKRYEVKKDTQLREGENLESPKMELLKVGTMVLLLAFGSTDVRRAKVRASLSTGVFEGWISLKTKRGEPLVGSFLDPLHGYVKGRQFEVKYVVTVRQAEDLDSEEICKLEPGTLVRYEQGGVKDLRRALITAGDITGWVSMKTIKGEHLIGRPGPRDASELQAQEVYQNRHGPLDGFVQLMCDNDALKYRLRQDEWRGEYSNSGQFLTNEGDGFVRQSYRNFYQF